MSIATRLYYGLGHLLPMAGGDPEFASPTPGFWMPGQIGFLMDKYGERYFQMIQNRGSGTLAIGALSSAYGDANGLTTVTATAGTVNQVTSTFTADKHAGAIVVIKDDAGAAGAAPEGEDSICERNSATILYTTKDLPFTVAPANNDTVEIQSTWGVDVATAGDLGRMCRGVVVPESGIAATYFGLTQIFGICRRVNVLLNAVLAPASMLIAAASTVTVTGAASGHRLHVGTALTTCSTDQVLSKVVAMLAMGSYAKSFSDVDALA